MFLREFFCLSPKGVIESLNYNLYFGISLIYNKCLGKVLTTITFASVFSVFKEMWSFGSFHTLKETYTEWWEHASKTSADRSIRGKLIQNLIHSIFQWYEGSLNIKLTCRSPQMSRHRLLFFCGWGQKITNNVVYFLSGCSWINQ